MNRACTAVIALLSLSIAQTAEAQKSSSVRLGVSINPNSSPITSFSDTSAAADSTGTAKRVFHGAVIGGLIGAAAGLLTAFLITGPLANYPDHSEDGIVLLPLITLGAVGGFIVGGVAGYLRK